MMSKRYSLVAHTSASDYYADREHPGHTLWPHGIIIAGLSKAEARVIAKALNAALKAGELVCDST